MSERELAAGENFDLLVIGAGPTGLACAIEAQKAGFRVVLVDKGCLCNSLFHYPSHMTFFTTSELLETVSLAPRALEVLREILGLFGDRLDGAQRILVAPTLVGAVGGLGLLDQSLAVERRGHVGGIADLRRDLWWQRLARRQGGERRGARPGRSVHTAGRGSGRLRGRVSCPGPRRPR